MTGSVAMAALPSGAGLDVPASPWRRRLRLLLLLGGLAVGFWLIGLLFGSPHARAEAAPKPPGLSQQLAVTTQQVAEPLRATSQQLLGTVQQTTATVVPRAAHQVVRDVEPVVRDVVEPLATTVGTAVRSTTRTLSQVTSHVTREVATVARAITAPAVNPAAPPSHDAASGHRARPVMVAAERSGRAASLAHPPALSAAPHPGATPASDAANAPAPVPPASPQPAPGTPSAPSAGDAHDLTAVLPALGSPRGHLAGPAAGRAPVIAGESAEDPSFSPD